METKKCSKCGEEKPLSEFYRSSKNGHMNRCKSCDKEYKKERQRKGLVKRYRKPYVRVANLTPEQLEKRHIKDRARYARRNKEKVLATAILKSEIKERQRNREQQRLCAKINAYANKLIHAFRRLKNIMLIIKRDSAEYKEQQRLKRRAYEKAWRNRNPEKIAIMIEKRKANPNFLERRRKWQSAYYQKHKEAQKLQYKEVGYIYAKQRTENMPDSYIRGQLKQLGLPITPDLIEFKRVQLMLKREIKRQIADSQNQ